MLISSHTCRLNWKPHPVGEKQQSEQDGTKDFLVNHSCQILEPVPSCLEPVAFHKIVKDMLCVSGDFPHSWIWTAKAILSVSCENDSSSLKKPFEFDDTALSLPAWLTEESNLVTPKNESCTLEAQRLPPPVIQLRMSTQPLLHGQSHVHYNCGTYRHFNWHSVIPFYFQANVEIQEESSLGPG